MLDRLEPGMWELKMRDGGRSERLCLDDGRRLIQLRHPQVPCRQFVVEEPAALAMRSKPFLLLNGLSMLTFAIN